MTSLNKQDLKTVDKSLVYKQIVHFIQEEVKVFNKRGAVIGISGGIDSAVCAAAAVEALGKENVTLVHITERDTPKESKIHAKLVSEYLGIPLKIKNITVALTALGVYNLQPIMGFISTEKIKATYARKRHRELNKDNPIYIKHLLGEGDKKFRRDIAYYETKARLITVTLYMYANLENKLVIDTGNKTELSIGYYARYGEAGDIMPLADLYKTQVIEIAKYLKLPDKIINRPPSPDIIPGLTDSMNIGIDYVILDSILSLLGRIKEDKIAKNLNVPLSRAMYVKRIVALAKPLLNIPIKAKIKYKDSETSL